MAVPDGLESTMDAPLVYCSNTSEMYNTYYWGAVVGRHTGLPLRCGHACAYAHMCWSSQQACLILSLS